MIHSTHPASLEGRYGQSSPKRGAGCDGRRVPRAIWPRETVGLPTPACLVQSEEVVVHLMDDNSELPMLNDTTTLDLVAILHDGRSVDENVLVERIGDNRFRLLRSPAKAEKKISPYPV